VRDSSRPFLPQESHGTTYIGRECLPTPGYLSFRDPGEKMLSEHWSLRCAASLTRRWDESSQASLTSSNTQTGTRTKTGWVQLGEITHAYCTRIAHVSTDTSEPN
jgi:hypothetical protein